MAVERRAPSINWISSYILIVTAGLVYRGRKTIKSINSIPLHELLANIGIYFNKTPPTMYLRYDKQILPESYALIKRNSFYLSMMEVLLKKYPKN